MLTHTSVGGRPAFTLVELLIVIVIIAVLAAMLVPAAMRAMDQAYAVECQSNLQQIAKAVLNYTTDYRGAIPPTKIENSNQYWCNILARKYLPTENTSKLPPDVITSQHTVLICPVTTAERINPGGMTEASAKDFDWPDDNEAQGWVRLGSDDFATDCSYYWNGYVGTNAQLRERFPSLSVDLQNPREIDYHDISEIPQRSNMAMVADGVLFQDGSADKPQRIAARHPGSNGARRMTYIAFGPPYFLLPKR